MPRPPGARRKTRLEAQTNHSQNWLAGSEFGCTDRLRRRARGDEEPIIAEQFGRAMFSPEFLDLPSER
jgi:hypothetical protein